MKKTILVLSIVCCCLNSVSAQEEKQERILTDTEKIVGLSRLWEGVRNNFVYYDQLAFDWDSLYVASIPRVLEIKDTYEYLQELKRLAVLLGDGHTYVYHRGTLPREERISPAPFTTQFVEGKVLVDKVWSSDFEKQGVKRGTEVISINGMNVIEYGEKVLGQYVNTSTPQWLHHRIFNEYELTKGKRTDPVTIGFRNGRKEFLIALPDRNGVWDIQKRENELKKDEPKTETPRVEYVLLDGNIGHLKIRGFDDKSVTEQFIEVYPEILKSDALIIDVRNNGGGNSGYADYILTHLTDKPFKTSIWSSRMYIPAHASWNWPAEWYTREGYSQQPTKSRELYLKPVVLLINEGTFSAAEDFSVTYKGIKRGPIMGVPTGGSTGNGVWITLIEDLAYTNICSKKDIGPDGTVFVGVGVIPDIEAYQTVEGFLSGKDNVLEQAVAYLTGNK